MICSDACQHISESTPGMETSEFSAYMSMLLCPGFVRTYLEQVPEEQCHRGREGRTWIGRWTKRMPQAEQK